MFDSIKYKKIMEAQEKDLMKLYTQLKDCNKAFMKQQSKITKQEAEIKKMKKILSRKEVANLRNFTLLKNQLKTLKK